MTPEEKFDFMISTIEEMVKGKSENGITTYYSDNEIYNASIDLIDFGITNDREKNAVFKYFFKGKTALHYISERKIMYAYKYICTSETWDSCMDTVIGITGLGDQSAFTKKFSQSFLVSPKVAFANKDMTKYQEPVWWKNLSAGAKNGFSFYTTDEKTETKTHYGISVDVYNKAKLAGDLQARYDLNDREGELAFCLSEGKVFSLEEAFEYVYNYVWKFGWLQQLSEDDQPFVTDYNEERQDKDKNIEKILMDDDVLFLYKKHKYSFGKIMGMIFPYKFGLLKRDIRTCSNDYIEGFMRLNDSLFSLFDIMKLDWIFDGGYLETVAIYDSIYDYYFENKTDAYNANDFSIYMGICSLAHSASEDANFYVKAFDFVNPGSTDKTIPDNVFKYYEDMMCKKVEKESYDEYINGDHDYYSIAELCAEETGEDPEDILFRWKKEDEEKREEILRRKQNEIDAIELSDSSDIKEYIEKKMEIDRKYKQ